MHASSYKDPAQLRGKRVLVVGAGNTGCDIAVEAAQQASRCWHSTRRGYWYAPKYVLGRPADQVNDTLLALRVPLRVRQWLYHRTLRLTVGDLTRFGLPEARPPGLRDAPDRQQPARLLRRATAGSARCRTWPGSTPYGVELADGRRDRPRAGHLRHRLPAAVRVPRRRRCSATATARAGPRCGCNAFTPGHPTLAVAGLVQPDSGMFTAGALAERCCSPGCCGCAATGPERAAAFAPPGARRRRASGTPGRSRTAAGTGSRSATPTTCAPLQRALRRAGGRDK